MILMRDLARKTVCGAAMVAGLHGCASTNAPMPAVEGIKENFDAYVRLPSECKEERGYASCKVNSGQPIRIYGMDAEVSIADGRPRLELKDGKDHTGIWNSRMERLSFMHGDWSYDARIIMSALGQTGAIEFVNGQTVKNESAFSGSMSFMITKIAPVIDCGGKKTQMVRERTESYYPDTRRILGNDAHMSISVSPDGDSIEIRFFARVCETRKGTDACKEPKEPQKHQVKEGEAARFSSKETDKAVYVEQIFTDKGGQDVPHASLVIFKRPEDCKGI